MNLLGVITGTSKRRENKSAHTRTVKCGSIISLQAGVSLYLHYLIRALVHMVYGPEK